MKTDQRYIQPHNANEAMTLIQKLFNEYRHAPLTDVLLKYHNNLIYRLKYDIYKAAEKENNSQQLSDLNQMIQIMEAWTKIRLNNQPFEGKMKNFKLVTNNSPKFKRHLHKIKGPLNHQASRH